MRTLAATLCTGLFLTSFPAPRAQAQQADPPELSVAADGSGDHTTIQAAVDAAQAWAVVRIAPGEYAERVSIDKPLTLVGAGWEQTLVTSPYEASADDETPPAPTLRVKDATGVRLSGLKISHPGARREGAVQSGAAVLVEDAEVHIEACAILGSPANGISITGRSDAVVRASLVAGVGATGIAVVGLSAGRVPKALIEGCEIRNCVHRGITVGGNRGVHIENCRISGSSWHGIRYDGVGPTIKNNLIFDNARSGIYASGATSGTVTGNTFYRNRMNGISCWFRSEDRIEGNTFIGNLRSAVEVLGASRPQIRGNVFLEEQQAVYLGKIGSESEHAASTDQVDLRDNVFWKVKKKVVHGGELLAVAEANGNREENPGLSPPSLVSPWAPQPEEEGLGVAPPEAVQAQASTQELRAAAWNRSRPWVEDIMQIRDVEVRDAAVESVRGALGSSAPLERLAALTAFVGTAEATYERASFRPLVRPLVETETGYGQVQALYALLNSERRPEDCELVIELLRDPSPSLRESGTNLLRVACEMDITGAAAGAALGLLDTDDSRALREAMRGLWGVSASDEVQARLLEIAAGPSRHDAIYYGLSTLQNKNSKTVDFLIEVLEDPDFNNSGRALWGLTYGVSDEARPAAADAALLLFEARSSSRDDCVRILSSCGDASHLEAMRGMADNELLPEGLREATRNAIRAVESRL